MMRLQNPLCGEYTLLLADKSANGEVGARLDVNVAAYISGEKNAILTTSMSVYLTLRHSI